MQDLSWFLPSWPPVFGELVRFGALLVAGLLAANWRIALQVCRASPATSCRRRLRPHGLALMQAPLFAGARVFVDLALGLIVFELGHRFDLDWLGRNRWLALAALAKAWARSSPSMRVCCISTIRRCSRGRPPRSAPRSPQW